MEYLSMKSRYGCAIIFHLRNYVFIPYCQSICVGERSLLCWVGIITCFRRQNNSFAGCENYEFYYSWRFIAYIYIYINIYIYKFILNVTHVNKTGHDSLMSMHLDTSSFERSNDAEIADIRSWISEHYPSKMWGEITYTFPQFKQCSRWSLEMDSNVVQHSIIYVITYQCWIKINLY